jgi:replicative DNA helicase
MSAAEIAERELSNQTGINLRNILAGVGIGESDQRKLDGLGGSIAALSKRWAIDDRTYSISGIRRRARIIHNRMAREGIKTGVVILDYIQLAGENGEGREQSVAAISRGCKLMAKELGCTVLALSQLNRACESRDDRRPLMSDVRESGAIEQDADVVAFVYREGMYDESVPGSLAELIIRKHRSGPTGTVHLQFNEKTASFGDVQRETPVLTERVQQP